MFFLLSNREKLLEIKSEILEDAATDDAELEDRKRNRKIILASTAYFITSMALVLLSVCFSSEEFAMPFYSQLPLLSIRSHPGYEINYAFYCYFLAMTSSCVTGIDGIFLTIALHCISKLKAFSRLASELSDEHCREIHDFSAKHLKLMELIQAANAVFAVANLCQMMSTLGLFVLVCFQMQNGIDYKAAIMIIGIVVQLFFYCFLSECINAQSEKLKFSLYSCKWYEMDRVSKKKILFMLMMMNKPQRFTILSAWPMNLETFADIINRAYGYLTCLMNIT